MAIFNSKLLVYQRVTDMKILEPGEHACADEPSVVALPLPDGVLRTGSMARAGMALRNTMGTSKGRNNMSGIA